MNFECYFCHQILPPPDKKFIDGYDSTNFWNSIAYCPCHFCPHTPTTSYKISKVDNKLIDIQTHRAIIYLPNKNNHSHSVRQKHLSFCIFIPDQVSYISQMESEYCDDISFTTHEEIILSFNYIPNINPYNIEKKLPLYLTFL